MTLAAVFSPSAAALHAAHALASAHGHQWAQGSYEGERDLAREAGDLRTLAGFLECRAVTETPASPVPTTWEEACVDDLIARARNFNWPAGIGPTLRHTTGTGRLSWNVHPVTGDVELEVARPSGAVLRAQTRGSAVRVEVLGGYYLRHLETLEHALSVLGFATPPEVWAGVEETPEQLEAWAREAEAATGTGYAVTFRVNRAAFLRCLAQARGPSASRPFPRGMSAAEARQRARVARQSALRELAGSL